MVNAPKPRTPKKKKKKKKTQIYFPSSPVKQREVTNFAKGGKTCCFPHRTFNIFPFEIKILLYDTLEHPQQS